MQKLKLDNFVFEWGKRTYVMGILNITPDSFSGDGLAGDGREQVIDQVLEQALKQARGFVESGADILDVGGESTRPGAREVSADEEMDRVIPVIARLAGEVEALISIDTYKAAVAERALDAGADLINDVWGLRADPDLAGLIADRKVPVVIMHNRSNPQNARIKANLGGRYVGIEYQNLVEDVKQELLHSVQIARDAGIDREKIILDPGIGFGKTVSQNLELLNRLDEIRELGYPVLLGSSRKSFIGYTLDLPLEDRLEGTAATVAVGITRGADIVRVHDVREMVRVARMTDALVRA
ncbi:MAG: dihydropteroate synthase [Anaerolineales bacterium]|nr:dihydropteroate synthase [Anaerolineales bacterium]